MECLLMEGVDLTRAPVPRQNVIASEEPKNQQHPERRVRTGTVSERCRGDQDSNAVPRLIKCALVCAQFRILLRSETSRESFHLQPIAVQISPLLARSNTEPQEFILSDYNP